MPWSNRYHLSMHPVECMLERHGRASFAKGRHIKQQSARCVASSLIDRHFCRKFASNQHMHAVSKSLQGYAWQALGAWSAAAMSRRHACRGVNWSFGHLLFPSSSQHHISTRNNQLVSKAPTKCKHAPAQPSHPSGVQAALPALVIEGGEPRKMIIPGL